jgi:biotin-dependent carboxylase-like uncharacterized protein
MKYKIIKISNEPIFSSIQDEGRYTFEQFGVPNSGAGDKLSYRIGNLLLGNIFNSASIEILYGNTDFEFLNSTQICITGADMNPKINGIPVKMWEIINISKGDKLVLEASTKNLRTYLSVKNGIELDTTLNSKSTHSIFDLGGMRLSAGDIIHSSFINNEANIKEINFLKKIPNHFGEEKVFFATKGPEFDQLSDKSKMDIEGKKFKLSNRMSRTGALIEGSKLEVKNGTSDIISDGVSAGTIQLPKDGNMYILLEDSQRIGGYARILNLESSSLWAFTQLMPGDEFKIVITTIEDAQKRLKELNSILFDNNIFSERLFAEKNINVEGELINVKIFGESKEYIYINNMPLKIDF